MKKIRILSLDGGGIRGIISAKILCYLEAKLREHAGQEAFLADFVDMVAGTSTGGIITCAMLTPDDKGSPKMDMQEILELYLKQGKEIFPYNWMRKYLSLAYNEQFDSNGIESIFQEKFHDIKLSELLKPCLVTSYEMQKRFAKFFCSSEAKTNKTKEYFVRDVARATSAAPTFYEPALIESEYGEEMAYIDGGVFANNPTLCVYAEARKMFFSEILNNKLKPDQPTAKDMLIVSIGTGNVQEPYLYKDYKNAGGINWIRPILDIMMSGNAETVQYQLKQMYKTLKPKDQKDYYRLEPDLSFASSDMSNVVDENLLELEQAGLRFIAENQSVLDEIAIRLIEEA